MKKRLLCLAMSTLILTFGFAAIAGANKENKSTLTAEERLNQIIKDDGMVYGVLVAWNGDMGHGSDIGGTYRNNYRSGFSEEKWLEKLWNCKAMGFNMVKLWLSEAMEGIQFDETGRVIGIEATFKKNLITILDMAKDLDLNISLTLVPHLSMSAANKAEYDMYTRFVSNPEYTKGYIENFVNPMMDIVADYDNILMIDLYAEPEGDTYGPSGNYGLDRGTTWENMARFIREIGAAVKKCDPHMPITANTGWREYDPIANGRYNDLGLDYIGVDVYNNYGELKPLKELKATAPIMIGEFGATGGADSNWSDDFQTQLIDKFYQNAKDAGYKGAFYWMYGWQQDPASAGDPNTLVGADGELRPVASSLRFSALDREYANTGYDGMDKPAMLYSDSTLNIKWIGSRGANAYIVERSTDKRTWTKLAEINSPESIEFKAYMYRYQDKTAEQGKTYYYRVAVVDQEGNKLYSEASHPFKIKVITCSDEENLVKNHSFEDGDTSWKWEKQGQADSDMKIITGKPGETVHSGEKAVYIKSETPWDTNIEQKIQVKPNTNYTYTVYYKMVSGSSCFKILNGDYSTLGGDKQVAANGQWDYYTFDFNSGNNTEMYVLWADGTSETYIDDFYVFEKK